MDDKCPEMCMKKHPEYKKWKKQNVNDAVEEAIQIFGLDSKGRAKKG